MERPKSEPFDSMTFLDFARGTSLLPIHRNRSNTSDDGCCCQAVATLKHAGKCRLYGRHRDSAQIQMILITALLRFFSTCRGDDLRSFLSRILSLWTHFGRSRRHHLKQVSVSVTSLSAIVSCSCSK